jgi:YHS domain-containing protein
MTTTNQLTCPVCGMAVDETSSHSASYDGKQYYFCSQGCQDQFSADPDNYVR